MKRAAVDKRVVVTGVGLISCLGMGAGVNWKRLTRGDSGVSRIENFDTSGFPTKIAGEIKRRIIDELRIPDSSAIGLGERRLKFGIAAAREAIDDAELESREENSRRCGTSLAAGLGIIRLEEICNSIENGCFVGDRYASQISNIHPESNIRSPSDRLASIIASTYPLRGPSYTITSACAAGLQSVGQAYRVIQRGDCDVMVVGGADSMVNPVGMMGFELLGVLSTRNNEPEKACRPFDRKRDGLVVGEGAGIAVLEELEHACARNANIYCEIVGHGTSIDAHQLTAPCADGYGAASAMIRALSNAGVDETDVDYINAHGSSTILNDRIESKAIRNLFGTRASQIPVSSNKSMVGHLIGASGAYEFVVTALTVKHDLIPPTINYEDSDEGCDLDYVPNTARQQKIRYALTNSFGFGGQNASVVVSKYPGRG